MTIQTVITALLWFSAIGCGLMGGLYFAFSAFIMRALERIGAAPGIAAMNAINTGIVRSLFMPLFLGTTLAAAALAVLAFLHRGVPGSTAMGAAGLLYIAGMFVCTMVFNVPLNNALASANPATVAGEAVWTHYLKTWTLWNHVRTLASLAAAALFTAALVARCSA